MKINKKRSALRMTVYITRRRVIQLTDFDFVVWQIKVAPLNYKLVN